MLGRLKGGAGKKSVTSRTRASSRWSDRPSRGRQGAARRAAGNPIPGFPPRARCWSQRSGCSQMPGKYAGSQVSSSWPRVGARLHQPTRAGVSPPAVRNWPVFWPLGGGEVRAAEVRGGKTRAGQCDSEVRADQVRAGEVRAFDEGAAEVRAEQIDDGERRLGQLRMTEVCEAQVRGGEVRTHHARAAEVRAGEVNWLDVVLHIQRPTTVSAACRSGRIECFCSRPRGFDGGHCSRECSRMNAASTSITAG